jgi:hypothetical protein
MNCSWSRIRSVPVSIDRDDLRDYALFIGNEFSVILTSYLVPWAAKRLGWWLTPTKARRTLVNLQGAGLLVAAYTILILLFWTVF